MLIMITNKCNEMCPHCMECSNPQGAQIDERTFIKAVKFAEYIGCINITVSGGEPTLHPQFYEFCKQLQFKFDKMFTICSNGTWVTDQEKIKMMERVRGFSNCVGIQVYTNKLFYKDYELVKANESLFKQIGCTFEESEIRAMKDLGRAKSNEIAQKMNDESKYFQSCLNASLAGKQAKRPHDYGFILETLSHQFCHPMVDFNGNVHLSESWLCQSVGNVVDDQFADIWQNIVNFTPCRKCKDFQRFMNESTRQSDIAIARIVLGL